MCGISARPYRKSLSSHVQQLGRVMRPAPGKTFALWLDHSGNYLRFHNDTQELFEHGVQKLDDDDHDAQIGKGPDKKDVVELKCSCGRTEERRDGNECVSTCQSRWSTNN